MKLKLLFLSFLIFNFYCIRSQEVSDKPANALKEHFELPRESVYLHLNKSKYVEGEVLWFKGYVLDRLSGVPFKKTSNIYVGIYDSKGKQKDKRDTTAFSPDSASRPENAAAARDRRGST